MWQTIKYFRQGKFKNRRNMQIQDDYSDLVESVYIKGMNANVENNEIVTYGVNAKVSFKVDK